MSLDAIITLATCGYLFSAIGMLRIVLVDPPDSRLACLALAFLWPVWLPIVIAVALVVITANGVWEVL